MLNSIAPLPKQIGAHDRNQEAVLVLLLDRPAMDQIGNAAVEHVLSRDLPYVSGPEWLKNHVLRGRHVIAVSGTHGKTTVASLVAWMLHIVPSCPVVIVADASRPVRQPPQGSIPWGRRALKRSRIAFMIQACSLR